MQKRKYPALHILLGFILIFLMIACDNSSTSKKEDLSKYTLESIAGSDLQKAIFTDKDGIVLEEGYVLNGKKEGQWSYYTKDGEALIKVENYHDGLLFGHVLELNPRFELTKRSHYSMDQPEGYYAEYKRSRKKKEGFYKDGQRHGRQTQYHDFSDKILSEADFKDGKQHGIYRYYDDQGRVTLDYQYENGEKVSGGISK